MTKWAAVVGKPISHSLSPVLHTTAYELAGLDWEYRKYELGAEELPEFVIRLPEDCVGLSVTMPGKRAALELADVKDGLAKLVGAANTLVPTAGMWGAVNTDVHGIVETVRSAAGMSLEEFSSRNRSKEKRALLLGTGATASSALAAATTLGYTRIGVVGRNFQGVGNITIAARDLGVSFTPIRWERDDLISSWQTNSDLLISTVPPEVSGALVELVQPGSNQMILDVTYAKVSPLVDHYRKTGAQILDPLAMLTHQGLAQVKLMSGKEVPFSPVYRAVVAAAT